MMKFLQIAFMVCLLTSCSPKGDKSEAQGLAEVPGEAQAAALDEAQKPSDVPDVPADKAAKIAENLKEAEHDAPLPSGEDEAIGRAEKFMQDGRYEAALWAIYDEEIRHGASQKLENAYAKAIAGNPDLHAEPKRLVPGKDISGMKRLGGGSSLVYKFLKDGETVAAFKPFQKRFQSNYRSEIAAYRLCPVMKCGFAVPVNVPVYFDFDEFSSMYGRNPANLKSEFAEIIPTKLADGTYRVDGTCKAWIKDFADYPIEFSSYWKEWLNPGMDRKALRVPAAELLEGFAKQHKRGAKFAEKLAPHLGNLSIYDLARQISNMLVFDFLINNWDRFSGSPSLFGVNCQFANGRFMSIDNGAGFSQTPHPKPAKRLHEISRFSRLTYEAIRNFDKEKIAAYLFPNPTEFEKEKIETFWGQRDKYLKYVESCVEKNGEPETFFFE